MNSVNQFFKWFQNLGGTVPGNFEEVLNTRYVYDLDPVSSFKERAAEIKAKYNHKFRVKPIVIDHNFPDLDKLNFERKNGR